MEEKTYMEAYKTDMLGHWNGVANFRKPIIAAVNGFALGGKSLPYIMTCTREIPGPLSSPAQPQACPSSEYRPPWRAWQAVVSWP